MYAILLVLLMAVTANAQSLDPQAVARVGIHSLEEEGVGMLGWNPAALGPERGRNLSIELPSFTLSVGNNSFGVGFYNDMFTGDSTKELTNADKNEILDKIPDDGMALNLHAAAPGLGFTYRNFGFRVGVESSARGCLPKDFAVLVLKGNKLNREYGLDDLLGEAQAYADYAVGYAYKFDQSYLPEIYAGLSLHFYQGLSLVKTEKVDGYFVFDTTGMTTEGTVHSVSSVRGDGVGFDLGGMAKINDKLDVGLALRQIGAKLTWDVEENQLKTWHSDPDGLSPDGEPEFNDVDTTYDGGSVQTNLPVIIQMNAAYRPISKLHVLGDIAIRTSTTSQGKAGLEVGAAGQYHLTKWFIPQLGISLGGPFGSRFGAGMGLHMGGYELDLGGSWVGGAFNGAKGVGFGLSQRLKF